MVQKIPPPPPIATNDPVFNRWLLEVTNILNPSGGIDPSNVTGQTAVNTQVGTNTASITTLNGEVATLNTEVAANTTSIATINGEITTINGQITTLSARNQILNGSGAPAGGTGNNGDLYIDNTYPATNRLYAKIGGTWKSIV